MQDEIGREELRWSPMVPQGGFTLKKDTASWLIFESAVRVMEKRITSRLKGLWGKKRNIGRKRWLRVVESVRAEELVIMQESVALCEGEYVTYESVGVLKEGWERRLFALIGGRKTTSDDEVLAEAE